MSQVVRNVWGRAALHQLYQLILALVDGRDYVAVSRAVDSKTRPDSSASARSTMRLLHRGTVAASNTSP
jgi:hypothetical protein